MVWWVGRYVNLPLLEDAVVVKKKGSKEKEKKKKRREKKEKKGSWQRRRQRRMYRVLVNRQKRRVSISNSTDSKRGGCGEEVLDEWKFENCIGAPDGTGLVWSFFFFLRGVVTSTLTQSLRAAWGNGKRWSLLAETQFTCGLELKVKTRWTEEYIHN